MDVVAEVGGGRQAWGGPADSHGKVDAGWVRGMDSEGGSGDRWMGTSSMGSQHQRGGGGPGYGGHGGHSSSVTASSVGNNIYMTSSGPPQSNSMMIGGGGMSRQQDTRFNIAAITARRFWHSCWGAPLLDGHLGTSASFPVYSIVYPSLVWWGAILKPFHLVLCLWVLAG